MYIRKLRERKETGLAFEVDFLTNSIRNRISGDSVQTEVLKLMTVDLKQLTKKNGWLFDWKTELENNTKEVYKLTILHEPNSIQGAISFTINTDHVYMDLLESAPFNLGQNKRYEGVAGNLVAYACKISFERGFDGYVSFTAKTQLIEHYQRSLNAVLVGGQLMIINTLAASRLVDRYFKKV
ncbi:hypothetical protein [Spirosoma koreense]